MMMSGESWDEDYSDGVEPRYDDNMIEVRQQVVGDGDYEGSLGVWEEGERRRG